MSFAPKIDILSLIMTKLHLCENHQQKSLLKKSIFSTKKWFKSNKVKMHWNFDIDTRICAKMFFWAQEHISGQKSWFRPIPADLSNFEKSIFFVIFMIFVKWNVSGIGRKWPESYMICQHRFFGRFRCLLHQKSIFYRC